jgi:anti-sigma regulatory factor (Ser/Thr protein kinase)
MEQATLWSHETVLSADAGSAAKARAFVVHQLVEHRLLYLVDEVRLVASELATNAIVHAKTRFTVILEGRESSVLLTVRDGSPIAPVPSPGAPNEMRMAGRGLLIVNLMSQTWGVADQDGAAKSVWASFETRSRAVS